VNGWSLESLWRGFDIASMLALASPLPDAPYLRATSVGGYEDTSRISALIEGGAMLVTHMDGEPLSPERGKPVRLMIFDKYQFKECRIRDMTRLAQQHRAINLAQGFPDFDPPPDLVASAHRSLSEGHHQYSLTWGSLRFREALARKQKRFMGLDLGPDQHLTV